MTRVSWNQYFMQIAFLAATRSTCERRQVGAVIVKNNNIVSTGYNGAPAGVSHCAVAGCLRAKHNIPSGERHEMCRGAHAEQNAVAQAAKNGTAIDGATIYCTNMLCVFCAKLAINSGIKHVFFAEGYGDDMSLELLNEAGVTVTKVSKDEI